MLTKPVQAAAVLKLEGGGKANLRVVGHNLWVMDKYLCIVQNPWDKIFRSLEKSLGFGQN